MVLAWDLAHQVGMEWKPQAFVASAWSIVYTSEKAWMIIRPYKSFLDIKFYQTDELNSKLIRPKVDYKNKFAHHVKLEHEDKVEGELLDLLTKEYQEFLQKERKNN